MRGWLIEKGEAGTRAALTDIDEAGLPEGDVLVRMRYSTVNYKDALAYTGKAPVVRDFPMVPGIDGAGVVERSTSDLFAPGDEVIVNGWGLGETRWGCHAELASLRSEWLLPKPQGFTGVQCMAIGTAGYTAMLCVMALERHGVRPESGPILVTGAAGGVGSTAVAILSKLGFEVTASTGRTSEADYLTALGATEIVDRKELSEPGRPMARERWAGVVDSVGSVTLANVLAQTKYGGTVAACGLAQGGDLPASVYPFILRAVTLAGVDSVYAPLSLRRQAWERLDRDLERVKLERMTALEAPFDRVSALADDLLSGRIRGRVVVDVAT